MIIIIFGLPGSGKSYFASRLAEKIGSKYVNSDRIRKELFSERDYSEREKYIVYEKMLEEMRSALAQNNHLVLDATFHKKDTRKLFTDEMQGKEEIIFLEIQADEEIIRERVKKKREFSDADFDVYKRILQQNEPLTEPHLILQSTNDNIDEMLEKADVYLKNRE
ncbi:MAG: ATP-binding protein [Ginsengibacter sp.]|jgi:predicted kinase